MSSNLQQSVELLGALADPTRVRLLSLLETDELSVQELTAITELGQSRVSTHLARLREAELVQSRRAGSQRYYRSQWNTAPEDARGLWRAVRAQLSDSVLEGDRSRREALLAARDAEAPWVDTIAGRMEHHYSPGRTWEALTRGLLGFVEFGEVLDVGCGDGTVAQLLAPRSRQYTGLDKSEKVLAAARRRLGDADEVEFIKGDMKALPFDADRFDQVLLFHVLTYAQRPAQTISEAKRVLRPGGTLALVTLAKHPHRDITARYGHVNDGFEPQELAKLLRPLKVLSCEVTSRERRKPHFQIVTGFATKVPR